MSQRYIKKHLRIGKNKFKEGNNPYLSKGSHYGVTTNHPLRRSASLPHNHFSCLTKHIVRSSNRSKSETDLSKIYDNEDPLLNAKSEISLKTIAVRSTGYNMAAPTQQQLRMQRDIINQNMRMMAHRSSVDTSFSSRSFGGQSSQSLSPKDNQMFDVVRVPIVGYEVMEERARFTIFKLRIENKASNTNWLVLRRYTDFMRLFGKLKTQFPKAELPHFPRKKWFGNNFSSAFLDNRIQGLQTFINQVINNETLKSSAVIREFFCLDEAPAYSESMEECRAIFEAQEETISLLKKQLQDRDEMMEELNEKLQIEAKQTEFLRSVIRNTFGNCSKCSKDLDNQFKGANQLTYSSTKATI